MESYDVTKTKVLKGYYSDDEYGGDFSQEVYDDKKCLFRVANLCECPEDAIIGRDLFDAGDYISAIEYGMELARQGYSQIEIEWEEE